MKWSNALILEFLKLYEQEPAIWNPRHGLHKDRHEISDAWRRIEANFSVESSIDELKRKKDSLMATYRSLRNKMKQKERENWGTDDCYKPNWFAYETMFSFLEDVYQPKNSSNPQEIEGMHMEDLEDMENSLGDDSLLDGDDNADALLKQGTSFKLPLDRLNRKRREPNVNICMCENLAKDECSLYSQLLAKKLRAFDDNTREIVMHEIDNFVFGAKLRNRPRDGNDLIGSLSNAVVEDYAQGDEEFADEENAKILAPDGGQMATVLVKREIH